MKVSWDETYNISNIKSFGNWTRNPLRLALALNRRALRLVTTRERRRSELELETRERERRGRGTKRDEANSSKGFSEAVADGHGGAAAASNRGKQMVDAPHSHRFFALPPFSFFHFSVFFHFLGGGEGGILWPGCSPWVAACMCAAAELVLRGRRWR